MEQAAFYSALWGSILTSPAVRLPGVSFVLLHLNRKLSMEDQLYIMGSDIELMVRLCAAPYANDGSNAAIVVLGVKCHECSYDLLLPPKSTSIQIKRDKDIKKHTQN